MVKYLFGDLETPLIKANTYLSFKTGAFVYDYKDKTNEFFTKNTKEYIDFMLRMFSIKNKPIFYFHNMQFDLGVTFKDLILTRAKGLTVEFIMRGSQMLAVKFFTKVKYISKKEQKIISKRRCVAEIRDSLALLPEKLELIGKAFGIEKLDIDFETATESELKEYNLRDCHVLKVAIETLKNDVERVFNFKLKTMPLTLGSLSRRIIYAVYGTVYECYSEHINNYFRNYYFGGRCEVFDFNVQYGVTDGDINSLYPYVMKKYKYAIELTFISIEGSYNKIKNKNFYAIECEIEETGAYPLMPERVEKRLMFRVGIKKVLLFKEEFDYLIGLSSIKILFVFNVYYGKEENLFSVFIVKCYSLRKDESKPHYDLIFKLIPNSSYGKYGEKEEKEKIILKHKSIISLNEILQSEECINGFYVIRKTEKVKVKINVAIACKITAMARLELHKKMIYALNNKAKLIYCDTDSLFTDKPVFEIGNKLGDMKLVGNLERLLCLNAKEYAYDEIDEKKSLIRMKGFTKRTGSVKEFLESYLEPFIIERPTTFKESLKKMNEDIDYFSFVEEKTKHKRTFYSKRAINKDLSTRPIRTDEQIKDVVINNANILIKAYFNDYVKHFDKLKGVIKR